MTRDVRMRGFVARATSAEAEALIDARVRPLDVEGVPFTLAAGRVLAADIVSPVDLPPFAKSAMDGYAVRGADTPGTLPVVATLTAAERLDRPVGLGEAVRIMTGAAVPDGADAVVMVEDTTLRDGRVEIARAAPAGTNVLRRGEDVAVGQVVLEGGRRVRPQDVAMLASIGRLDVPVFRRPKVAIVPTGSELSPAETARPGAIVESNSHLLAALVERDGGVPRRHPIVPDRLELLAQVIGESDADLVVLTGGSSVGQEDLGPVVVRQLGELPIHGIDVRPASPTGIGFVDRKVVLLAPGYPVATYVAWDLFGRRILDRMLGREARLPYPTRELTLAAPFEKPEARLELRRFALAEGGAARLLPPGAALLSTLTAADGFVMFSPGRKRFEANERLVAYLFE